MTQGPTIHLIEDDDALRDAIGLLLDVAGFAVRSYASCADFLRESRLTGDDFLVADMHMSGMTGLALLEQLRRNGVTAPAIVMSGAATERIRRDVASAGGILVEKPFGGFEIVSAIEGALNRKTR